MSNELIAREEQSAARSTLCLPDSVRRLTTGKPGKSRFSEDGEFLGVSDDHWEVPAYVSPTDLDECRKSLVELEDYLRPAECNRLSGCIATLLQHYFIPETATNANQAAALQRSIAHDWLDAIGE